MKKKINILYYYIIVYSNYYFLNYDFMKCPKCNRLINSVEIKHISINENFNPKYNGVAYVCPNFDCDSIISVSIDPIAIKTDIIDWLFNRLRN